MPDKGFKLIDDKGNSRRNFLKNSGLTVGGIVLGGAVGSLLGLNKDVAQPVHTSAPVSASNPNAALMFFTPEQYQITMAASERIFPKDENGPGAKDLNAAIYIDHQLASPWGSNVKDYMLGAFKKPEPTQGKQLKILRKDLFILGLKGINDYSNKKHKRKFLELEAAEQDEILVAYEKGEADPLSGVSTTEFFSLLRTLTLEGVYADPMYGGNKDMQGWKMRKYPGSKMSYVNEVQSKKFVKLEPGSLNEHMGH